MSSASGVKSVPIGTLITDACAKTGDTTLRYLVTVNDPATRSLSPRRLAG